MRLLANQTYNITMKRILLLSLFIISFGPVANAQEASGNKFFPKAKQSDTLSLREGVNTVTDIPESTIIEDKYAGEYQEANVENFSRLYWAKNILDIDDDKVIDNFIMINECKYYRENIDNDFKWEKARKAARAMIKDQVHTYDDKYQILVPVDLGRYDAERKGFPIKKDSAFKDLRRVEIGGNDGKVCGEKWEIKHFPRNVHLILNKPFNFDFFELDEHLAQAFILRYNFNKPKRPDEYKHSSFERLAFVRFRMRLVEYQGKDRERHRTTVAVMFGQIDGIDVFENPDETGLLATYNFKDNADILEASEKLDATEVSKEKKKKKKEPKVKPLFRSN